MPKSISRRGWGLRGKRRQARPRRTQLSDGLGRPIGMRWFSIDERRHVLEIDCEPALELYLDADERGVFAVWVDSETGKPLWIADVGEA